MRAKLSPKHKELDPRRGSIPGGTWRIPGVNIRGSWARLGRWSLGMSPWRETAWPSPGHFGWWLRKDSWRERNPGGCRLLEATFPKCLPVCIPCPPQKHSPESNSLHFSGPLSLVSCRCNICVSTPPSVFCPAHFLLFIFQQSLRRASHYLCPGTPTSTAWSSKSTRSVRSGTWWGCFWVDGY